MTADPVAASPRFHYVPAGTGAPCHEPAGAVAGDPRASTVVDPGAKWRWRGRPGPMLRLTGSRLEEAAVRYGKGESIAGLAAAFNICPTTVSRALRACGTKMRRRGRPSGRSPRVAALAAQVVTMRSQGIAFVEIGAALGITASRAGQLAGEPLAITKTTETLPVGHLVRRARRRAYLAVKRGKIPHPNKIPCIDCGCQREPGDPRHEFWIEPRPSGGWKLTALCIPHRRRRARLLQAGRSLPAGQGLEGLTSRVPRGTAAETAG